MKKQKLAELFGASIYDNTNCTYAHMMEDWGTSITVAQMEVMELSLLCLSRVRSKICFRHSRLVDQAGGIRTNEHFSFGFRLK